MFVARLRPLYYISDKIIIRNLRNSRLPRTDPNPGLSHRLKAFQEDGIKIQDEDAEEFIDRSDSDFSYVGEAYNEHMNETLVGQYVLKHRIVKDKYFKENMPNLLTWSEKEQIRHLATTAPDEWTPEKLADSFPVTEQTVKKLLKYPWKPATKERISRHDASVMRNWRELKEGSLTISEELREHFLKYSDRSIPPLNPESIKIDLTQERKIGEFEKIVQRCAAKEEQHDAAENFSKEEISNKKISKEDKKFVTLDELKENIKKRLDKGRNIQLNDEIIVHTVANDNENITKNSNSNRDIELHKDKDNNLTAFKANDELDNKNIMEYPERIRIPKKAYKKGATYKVNDCYYDHDGKFLYRVLGMSN